MTGKSRSSYGVTIGLLAFLVAVSFAHTVNGEQHPSAPVSRADTAKNTVHTVVTVPETGTLSERRIAHYTLALALFTAALVIVGGIQLGLFYWQLRLIRSSLTDAKIAADAAALGASAAKESADATKESVATMKDTAERQLRAYVVLVQTVDLNDGTPLPAVLPYVFHFKNCGQTPAYDFEVIGATKCAPLNFEGPRGQITLTDPPAKATLGPGGVLNFPIPPISVPPEMAAVLNAKTHTIYIYGSAKYRDIFGKTRHTKFRLKRDIGRHTLSLCDEGNEAD